MLKKKQNDVSGYSDVFDEVAAIFAANGVEITESMLQLMAPLMDGSQSFEEHRASLKVELEDSEIDA